MRKLSAVLTAISVLLVVALSFAGEASKIPEPKMKLKCDNGATIVKRFEGVANSGESFIMDSVEINSVGMFAYGKYLKSGKEVFLAKPPFLDSGLISVGKSVFDSMLEEQAPNYKNWLYGQQPNDCAVAE
jgi:hypothetical protein